MKYFLSYYNVYGFKEETVRTFEADDNANKGEVMKKAMELIKDYEKTIISQSFYVYIDNMIEVFDGECVDIVVENDNGEAFLRWKIHLPFTIDLVKEKLWFRGTSTALEFDIPDTSMSVAEIMAEYK